MKSIREQLGLTQAMLASAIGVSQGNISHCETQKQFLSPEIAISVVRMARERGIHVSLDDIYALAAPLETS